MKIVKYGAVLIGAYLVVNYADGAATDAKAGGNALSSIVKSLQGRN